MEKVLEWRSDRSWIQQLWNSFPSCSRLVGGSEYLHHTQGVVLNSAGLQGILACATQSSGISWKDIQHQIIGNINADKKSIWLSLIRIIDWKRLNTESFETLFAYIFTIALRFETPPTNSAHHIVTIDLHKVRCVKTRDTMAAAICGKMSKQHMFHLRQASAGMKKSLCLGMHSFPC